MTPFGMTNRSYLSFRAGSEESFFDVGSEAVACYTLPLVLSSWIRQAIMSSKCSNGSGLGIAVGSAPSCTVFGAWRSAKHITFCSLRHTSRIPQVYHQFSPGKLRVLFSPRQRQIQVAGESLRFAVETWWLPAGDWCASAKWQWANYISEFTYRGKILIFSGGRRTIRASPVCRQGTTLVALPRSW